MDLSVWGVLLINDRTQQQQRMWKTESQHHPFQDPDSLTGIETVFGGSSPCCDKVPGIILPMGLKKDSVHTGRAVWQWKDQKRVGVTGSKEVKMNVSHIQGGASHLS